MFEMHIWDVFGIKLFFLAVVLIWVIIIFFSYALSSALFTARRMRWEMMVNIEYESLCEVDVAGDLNVHSLEKMRIKHAIL
jgi:hypothetical protein